MEASMTVLDATALEDLPPFLRTPEVAKLMRKSTNSVVQDRYLGLGPRYIRDGRRILYAKADVIAYLREHTVQPDDNRAASTPETTIAQPLRT
jgi:hypothetical protein